jgi:hypothetical protein
MRLITSTGVVEPIEMLTKRTSTCGGAVVRKERINLVADSKSTKLKRKMMMMPMMRSIKLVSKRRIFQGLNVSVANK